MRRTAIPAIALTLAALVAGCTTGPAVENWAAADLMVVGLQDSRPVLIGVDVESNRAFVAADLHEVGIKSADTSAVSYGSGRFLLDWSADNQPRRYAWLEPAKQAVRLLDAPPVDLGIVQLADPQHVLGVAAFAESSPTVSRLSLTDDRLESSKALALTPAALGVGESRSVVVGTTDRDGTVIQQVSAELVLGPPVVVASDALPGRVSVAGTYTAVALNKRVPPGVSPRARAFFPDDNRIAVVTRGRPVRYVSGAGAPWFVTAVDPRRVATTGVRDGRQVIQIVDLAAASVTRSIALPDAGPPQGLVTLPTGKVAVLQPDKVTVVDPNSGSTTDIALPVTTATIWTS